MKTESSVRLTPRAIEMRRLVEEQRVSGLTVNEFARRRGMTASTFWHWRQRFRDSMTSPSAALIPVRIVDDEVVASVRSDRHPRIVSPLVVESRSGRRIEIACGFSADDLRRVIEVVESC